MRRRDPLPVGPLAALWMNLKAEAEANPNLAVAVVVILAILALIVVMGLCPSAAKGDTAIDRLWAGIVVEESRGNPRAWKQDEDAAGIVQIRPICLADVNRIAKARLLPDRFTLADRWDPVKSRRMFDIYLGFWGAEWARKTRRDSVPLSILAAIWNGGPTGPRKATALAYWRRVEGHMKAARKKD